MNSTKYNLAILPWQQFEVLAFKCLQIDISPSIQFIEGGHDKGRDFLFEGKHIFFGDVEKHHKAVFQCKHKTTTDGFQNLKSDLTKELEKIYIKNKLTYDAYCLVTNLTLSGDEFDELKETFIQFIQKNDLGFEVTFHLYSYRHLESAIDNSSQLKWDFPSIISQPDFKHMLEQILLEPQRSFNNAWLSIFNKNRERFVYTSIYEEAKEKLKTLNVLLLSGPPKSGKTFTAEMLMLNTFIHESFTPYKIDAPEDIEKFYNPMEKQIFLLDDTFGRHELDLYRADTIGRKFEFILEIIDSNHKFLFTSREYIVRAFADYSSTELEKFINKILVETSRWSIGEKDSLFRKYYSLKFPDGAPVSDEQIIEIAKHEKFSPETIRAYFESITEFKLSELNTHLELPDNYLKNLFINLPEDKRVVLLSVLLSLRNTEVTIAHAFQNICSDLGKTLLLDLKRALNILEGSLIKIGQTKYTFYHPSMFDFFIGFLSQDIAVYRKVMIQNLNLDLLSLIKFEKAKTVVSAYKIIHIEENDLHILTTGLQRIIINPSSSLHELNTILYWLNNPDVQIFLKIKLRNRFKDFKQSLLDTLKSLSFIRFKDEETEQLATFFQLVYHQDHTIKLEESELLEIISHKKDDIKGWLLIWKIIPFLPKQTVLESPVIRKEWLNKFYTDLKQELSSLGRELFGAVYPNFEEVRRYRELLEQKNFTEASKIVKKSISDYKLPTNSNWFPRYKICKEKILSLKLTEFGYTIYNRILPLYEPLSMLEENQKNRYYFNKEKKWW